MRQKIARVLSEETLMPLGLVLMILGGVYMGAQSFNQIEANAKSIDKLEEKSDRTDEVINRIDRRLSRIEGALDIKEDSRDAKPTH
jgi:hypothetical protein